MHAGLSDMLVTIRSIGLRTHRWTWSKRVTSGLLSRVDFTVNDTMLNDKKIVSKIQLSEGDVGRR